MECSTQRDEWCDLGLKKKKLFYVLGFLVP